MNATEFDRFKRIGNEEYARSSPHFRGMPFEEAIQIVLKDFETRIAPQGLETPTQIFLTILNGDENVGYLHLGEYPKGSKSLYAWNFRINEEKRAQGIGQATVIAAKSYLKGRGYEKLALNVFADNRPAIHVYEKFGFRTTQFNMEAEL